MIRALTSNQRDSSAAGTGGIILIPMGGVVGPGDALLALWPEESVARF